MILELTYKKTGTMPFLTFRIKTGKHNSNF